MAEGGDRLVDQVIDEDLGENEGESPDTKITSQNESSSPTKRREAGSIATRLSKEDIRLVYRFEKVLGSGNFGTVRVASKITNS